MSETKMTANRDPRTSLWQFCTKYAKAKNAVRKRQQHLANLAARAANKGRKK